jgi:hypothetical protein
MVSRHRVVVFYLFAYTISWIPGFTYAILNARGPFASPLVPVLLLLATSYGPTLAAVLTLALLRELDETSRFRRHLVTWRAGLGWYGLALLLPAALWAAGALFSTGALGGGVAFVPAAAAAFPALLLANAGEEIGWRGCARCRRAWCSVPSGQGSISRSMSPSWDDSSFWSPCSWACL